MDEERIRSTPRNDASPSLLLTGPTTSRQSNNNNHNNHNHNHNNNTRENSNCATRFKSIIVLLGLALNGLMLRALIPNMRNYRGDEEFVNQNCSDPWAVGIAIGAFLGGFPLFAFLHFLIGLLLPSINAFKRATEGQWLPVKCFIIGTTRSNPAEEVFVSYRIVRTDWIEGKKYTRKERIGETEYLNLSTENNFHETGTGLPTQEEYRYLPGYPLSTTMEWMAKDNFYRVLISFMCPVVFVMLCMITLLNFYVGGFLNWNHHGCREFVVGLTIGTVSVLTFLPCTLKCKNGKLMSGEDLVLNGRSVTGQETWKEVASNDDITLEDSIELI